MFLTPSLKTLNGLCGFEVQSLLSSVFLFHPEFDNCLFFFFLCGHCFSSHQSLFTKCLPPTCSLHVPGTKSAQLYMPRRLPRGWPSVPTSGPLPDSLWKLPYKVYSVQIWWAWTGELMMDETDANRSRTTTEGKPPKVVHFVFLCPPNSPFQCLVWASSPGRSACAQGGLQRVPSPVCPLLSHFPRSPLKTSLSYTLVYPSPICWLTKDTHNRN